MERAGDASAVPGARRRNRARLEARLRAEAPRYSFFQAVRLLEAAARDDAVDGQTPSLGDRTRPRNETVRISAAQGLHFPETEIAAASDGPRGRLVLKTLIMGLSGPSGVLPEHYSAFVLREQRREGDALAEFFDIFNHRALSLFYRAWRKYRPSSAVEADGAAGRDAISSVVAAACGLYGQALRERTGVKDVALLGYAGQLSRRADPEGLASILHDAISQPVRIEPFASGWVDIAHDERTRLSAGRGSWSVLGSNAVLGSRHWDAQRKFRIVIGPTTIEAFRDLLPGGPLHRRAADIARLAVGPGLDFDFEVRISRDAAPPLRIGDRDARLGWSSWLPKGASRETFCSAVLPAVARSASVT